MVCSCPVAEWKTQVGKTVVPPAVTLVPLSWVIPAGLCQIAEASSAWAAKASACPEARAPCCGTSIAPPKTEPLTPESESKTLVKTRDLELRMNRPVGDCHCRRNSARRHRRNGQTAQTHGVRQTLHRQGLRRVLGSQQLLRL